ncbi:hypothetical protein [Bacillus toyonensis]|uniref:hypothetical protein n=1 Tax=Bacillus toyonensis TaxID=155322 RepID=UPI002E1A26F8|nr:hypothetical protein [Bacillus toyonensis]
MNWTKNISRWDTLMELKEDHKVLGFKGWIYFVSDFARDLKTDKLKCVIHTPTFTGIGVGTGIDCYVLDDEELMQLFKPIEKTFKEYEKELEDNYFKQK